MSGTLYSGDSTPNPAANAQAQPKPLWPKITQNRLSVLLLLSEGCQDRVCNEGLGVFSVNSSPV